MKVSPQFAREYALETALGNWGGAFEDGDREGQLRWLRIASQVGLALQAMTGESSVYDSAIAIERLADNRARLQDLAVGHREFQKGMSAYRPLRTGEAAIHFSAARDALGRAGSPIKLWALCGLARVWGYEGRYEKASQVYRMILPQAERQQFFSLAGWAQWGLAWIDARRGRPASALSRTLAMEKAYRRAEEAENLGAAHLLIGQALTLLGQRESGWQYNYRALGELARFPSTLRRHVQLMGVATDAFEEGLPEASLLIQEENLRIDRELRDPIRLAETYAARARILSALARPDEAIREIEDAETASRGTAQDSTGRKLRADLLWAGGEVRLHRDPVLAVDLLSKAIVEYEALNAQAAVAYASIMRSQAYQILGLNKEANADLEKVLQILEDPAVHIQDEDARLSYTDSIADTYDDVIRFQWDKEHDFEGSLRTLERSRNPSASARNGDLRTDRLPEDVVVVEYALLKDRLLTWVLDRRGSRQFETRVLASSFSIGVDEFNKSIQTGADEAQVKRLAAELYNLLIPGSIAGLAESQSIYFIPDKCLNKLPFAALWNRRSGRYLIEEHPVAVSSSLYSLLQVETTSPTAADSPITSVLLVGNPAFDHGLFQDLPDLPFAEEEMAKAGESFPASETLGADKATKLNVLNRLDEFDAFVFAGHAVINRGQPSQSYLVLAPSQEPSDPGILLGSEIQERKFRRLKVVILSACSSIGPNTSRTSGISGIARPFLKAGVPSVVGTLWNVSDAGNEKILLDFYRLLARGARPINALREMQVGAIHQSNTGWLPLRNWNSFEVVSDR